MESKSIPTWANCIRRHLLLKGVRRGFLAIMLLGMLAGCTFHVPVAPSPKIPGAPQIYPLKVGIFIERPQLEQVYSKNGFFLVGMAHTWKVPVGEGLQKASVRSFSQLFAEVRSIFSLEEGKYNPLNIIFTPAIREFRISQTITTDFFLKATILDANGSVIYEKGVCGETQGSGPFITACFGGVFFAEQAFSQSVNSAFEDAFEKLFIDITQTVNFSRIY